MTEPNDTQEMLSPEGRQRIANRLRFIADNLQRGLITPDSFDQEIEWVSVLPKADGLRRKSPSGRISLNLSYWTTPIDNL